MKGDEHVDGRVRVPPKLAMALRSLGVRTERLEEPRRFRGFCLVSESAMRLWEVRAAIQHMACARYVLWKEALMRADVDEAWSRAVASAFVCDAASVVALLPQKLPIYLDESAPADDGRQSLLRALRSLER